MIEWGLASIACAVILAVRYYGGHWISVRLGRKSTDVFSNIRSGTFFTFLLILGGWAVSALILPSQSPWWFVCFFAIYFVSSLVSQALYGAKIDKNDGSI